MEQRIRSRKIVFSGALLGSFRGTVDPRAMPAFGEVESGRFDYLGPLETGTPPGRKPPPARELVAWAEQKGLGTGIRAGFRAARIIARRGTRARKFSGSAFRGARIQIQRQLVPRMLREFQSRWGA